MNPNTGEVHNLDYIKPECNYDDIANPKMLSDTDRFGALNEANLLKPTANNACDHCNSITYKSIFF